LSIDMQSFQHFTPPLRLFHGPESLGQLGRELDRLNSKRAVIVCGGTLARDATLLDAVRSAMGDRCAGLFPGVRAHSPVPSVVAGAEELKRLQADAVIALGGGSAIVTARAASILSAEGRDLRALCTTPDGKGGLNSPKLLAPKLPQLVIPTTPTTAAVKAGSAVYDPVGGERLALFDPKTRAHAIFIDRRMLQSAPRALVASAGLNTFATAIEGLMSRTRNPLADALLMHAVRLLGQHLPDVARHDDATVRGDLVLAAVLCGQGTDHTGAGITTVLGHALGARHELENGTVNAIVLPHALRFNAGASAAGLAKVAAALGLPPNDTERLLPAVVKAVQMIFSTLDLPPRLRDVGIPAEALPAVAATAMGDWFLRSNPRPISGAKELQDVLETAW
jgi:alcohol dehydrogenase